MEKLKGHISNYTYVWHSGGGCAACKALDGQEFSSSEETPSSPHPNCQCWVEAIENIEESETSDDMLEEKREEKKKKEKEKEKRNRDEFELLLGDTLSLISEVNATINLFLQSSAATKSADRDIYEHYQRNLENLRIKLTYFYGTLLEGENYSDDILDSFIPQKRAEYYTYENYHLKIINSIDNDLMRYEKNLQKENRFRDDIDKHEQMLDLIRHSHNKGEDELLHGYEEVARVHDEKSGMDATVYKNNSEVVIVYPGSEQFYADFYKSDTGLATKQENNQYESAKKVYEAVKNNPEFENHKVIIAGYSLGGNTGAVVGAEANVDTVVFEPFGSERGVIQRVADERGQELEVHPEKVVTYQQTGDVLTKTGDEGHIGTVYVIPVNAGPFGSHNLDNINDLNTRMEDYENRNPQTIYLPPVKHNAN